MKITHTLILATLGAMLFTGCVGRTGKVGKPIASVYETQLSALTLGHSTPDDLKRVFTIAHTNEPARPLQPSVAGRQSSNEPVTVTKTKVLVSLKEARIENGKKVEIYELEKGGGMDIPSFVMWGYVAYNKDQELLFRFEDGKLVSYDSVVLPDPVDQPVTPISKTPK